MVLANERLLEQLRSAFQGVTREGGVSWLEADIIDVYGTALARKEARDKETDHIWMDVAVDPNWLIDHYDSNWSFLDAIGFRYYLPAAMARHLVLGKPVLESYRLTPPDNLGQWRFSQEQIAVIVGYINHCISEEAWRRLDQALEELGIELESYLETNPEFEIDPIEWSEWREAMYFWTRILSSGKTI